MIDKIMGSKRFLLAIAAIMLQILSALGQELPTVKIGDLNYRLDNINKTASVTNPGISYSVDINYRGDIVIPSEVVYKNETYSVTTIDESAFTPQQYITGSHCISSITIPKSVTVIEDNAFSGCYGLLSIKVDEENNVYDSRGGCNAIIEKSSNTLIAGSNSTIIPQSVTSIGASAFSSRRYLNSITIPDGVTSIGIYAFSNCSGLTSIAIPKSVTSIGDRAFSGCSNLNDVYCYAEEMGFTNNPFSCKGILHVHDVLINDFKNVWPNFTKYQGLDNTDFTLTYYVDGEKYKSVNYKYEEKITPEVYPTKKGYVFSGWKNLPYTMPANNIDIHGYFNDMASKTIDNIIYNVVDVNNGLVAIVGNTDASGYVLIPSTVSIDGFDFSVISLLENAFKGNELITSFVIPGPVLKIGSNAFNGCKEISTIEIGLGVEEIGERAFANINKLNDVYCYAEEVPETDRTAFENSYIDYVTLHVPAGSVDKYKAVGPWKDFKDVVGIAATGDQKCATPTIKFENGKISFACETEGVKFRYQITSDDIKQDTGAEVEFGGVYNVSVYASKEGYMDSDKATKEIKLSVINGDLNGDGKVDVSDHVTLSDIIMNQKEETE